MRRVNLFFPAASTFMLFLLSSCGTAPLAGPAAKPAGQGSVGEASFIGYKCKAVREWIRPFQHQYPDIDLASVPPDYQSIPQIGNLFRDSSFIPVFGFPYTSENAGKLTAINSKVIAPCSVDGQNISFYESALFEQLKNFFARTFVRFDPAVEKLAKRNSIYQEWMKAALNELNILPLDTSGLERLEQELAAPAQLFLAPLWPREQQTFMNALAAKRKEITDRIAGLPPALTLPPAPAPQQAAPVLPPPTQQPPQTVGERVAERWFEMVEIPLTMAGRQQSTNWLIAFDREFAAYNDNTEVISARRAWLLSREEIFKATKPDFMARLNKLPTGPGSEAAHAQLLIETFPLRPDTTMAVYLDYRAETLVRQKPLARRTFEKTMDSILAVRDWLAQAARKAIRGIPQK